MGRIALNEYRRILFLYSFKTMVVM